MGSWPQSPVLAMDSDVVGIFAAHILVPVHTVRFGDSMLYGARRVFAAFGAAMLSSFLHHTGSSPPVEPFLVLSLLSAAYGLGKL